jgi:hypothetical protein
MKKSHHGCADFMLELEFAPPSSGEMLRHISINVARCNRLHLSCKLVIVVVVHVARFCLSCCDIPNNFWATNDVLYINCTLKINCCMHVLKMS